MTIKNGDLPAMPVEHMDYMHIKDKPYCNGLTKREYFAALAMQGILANGTQRIHGDMYQFLAHVAVKQADTLLKELENSK